MMDRSMNFGRTFAWIFFFHLSSFVSLASLVVFVVFLVTLSFLSSAFATISISNVMMMQHKLHSPSKVVQFN